MNNLYKILVEHDETWLIDEEQSKCYIDVAKEVDYNFPPTSKTINDVTSYLQSKIKEALIDVDGENSDQQKILKHAALKYYADGVNKNTFLF